MIAGRFSGPRSTDLQRPCTRAFASDGSAPSLRSLLVDTREPASAAWPMARAWRPVQLIGSVYSPRCPCSTAFVRGASGERARMHRRLGTEPMPGGSAVSCRRGPAETERPTSSSLRPHDPRRACASLRDLPTRHRGVDRTLLPCPRHETRSRRSHPPEHPEHGSDHAGFVCEACVGRVGGVCGDQAEHGRVGAGDDLDALDDESSAIPEDGHLAGGGGLVTRQLRCNQGVTSCIECWNRGFARSMPDLANVRELCATKEFSGVCPRPPTPGVTRSDIAHRVTGESAVHLLQFPSVSGVAASNASSSRLRPCENLCSRWMKHRARSPCMYARRAVPTAESTAPTTPTNATATVGSQPQPSGAPVSQAAAADDPKTAAIVVVSEFHVS